MSDENEAEETVFLLETSVKGDVDLTLTPHRKVPKMQIGQKQDRHQTRPWEMSQDSKTEDSTTSIKTILL